jgi:hypothetical protein
LVQTAATDELMFSTPSVKPLSAHSTEELMTRRDWWLGILVLLIALLLQTAVLFYVTRRASEVAHAPRHVPTVAWNANLN